MSLRPIIFPLLSCLLAGTAPAALVNIAANTLAEPVRDIFTTLGAPLPAGNAVRIGTFPAGDPVITPTSTFASVNALFVPLAEDPVDAADGTSPPLVISSVLGPGKFAGTINNVDNADSRFAPGTSLYIFVLDADYSNLAAATQWAIFRDPAWTIPTTATRTLTTSQIDSQSEMMVGIQSAGGIRLAVIPEVSSSVLIVMAAGLTGLRRRRR